MQDARSRARGYLEEFVSAWLSGDREPVTRACSPAVRWWTPLTDREATGPAEAWAALEQVLAPVPRPIEVTALAADEDGARGVVELRSEATSGARPALFVTSVVTLSGGTVVEGRTYTDLDLHARAGGGNDERSL